MQHFTSVTSLMWGFAFRRVMELLIQDWSLSAKLRLPAISRLQKVHNVDVSLQVLKSKGVDLKDEHGKHEHAQPERTRVHQMLLKSLYFLTESFPSRMCITYGAVFSIFLTRVNYYLFHFSVTACDFKANLFVLDHKRRQHNGMLCFSCDNVMLCAGAPPH